MPPKDTKLGPGTLYIETPEGLQPLGSITEATAIEAEETEWAEDRPAVIKTAQEATFTAEVKINPDVAKAFTALGEACKQTAKALGKALRAAAVWIVSIKEAPPRVRHLALRGKKHRTRKKNINRALREHQRRSQKSDRA